MSMILTGAVKGMRPVTGVVTEGSRKGERWYFMSLEIVDPRYGNIYSCQLRSQDKQYQDMVTKTMVDNPDSPGEKVEKHVLKPEYDYTGHRVEARVMQITAGERETVDKATGQTTTVLQTRVQVTKLKDLGDAEDD